MTTQPLSDVRVLDLSRLLPGPFATMVLADLGAHVDKVEDPKGGDYLRFMPPQADDGMNVVFHALNRGKRSLVLDLKRPEGREALLRMIGRYDVLVESFRPGVMDKLGLGWDVLSARHPGLVVCAISGYGQDGPMASRAGHDLNYLARAGVLGITGPEGGPPQVPGVQLADIGGGALYAVVGILSALHARAGGGGGRHVDVAMSEGAASFAAFGVLSRLGGMATAAGGGVLDGGIAPYNTYRTKDGRSVSLAALEPKFWNAFCQGAGIEPSMEALGPGPHQAEWKAKLAAIFADRTRDEWAAFAATHDCCLEPVLEPGELADDPQHTHRRLFIEGPVAAGRTLPVPRAPVASRDVPAAGKAPGQGEQGEAILTEAGFTPEEIAALRETGATR